MSYKLFNMDGQRYYTFARSNVRFFVLDSTQLDPEQFTPGRDARDAGGAIEDLLLPSSALLDADRHGSYVDMRVLLEPVPFAYGVNVVFSGHDHIYERVKPQKGIYYFVRAPPDSSKGRTCAQTEDAAAYFDQDQSFMLVEVVKTTTCSLSVNLEDRQRRRLRRHPSRAVVDERFEHGGCPRPVNDERL